MANLGRQYRNGWSVPKDEAESSRWYQRAAEAGHAGAQFVIGGRLLKGVGVAPDVQAALKWLRSAAEQGETNAILVLVEIYEVQ
jgi:TPR repeat protein